MLDHAEHKAPTRQRELVHIPRGRINPNPRWTQKNTNCPVFYTLYLVLIVMFSRDIVLEEHTRQESVCPEESTS